MGYCYQGRLRCCDGCGKAGGTTLRKCPEGWCQAAALCAACWRGAVGDRCRGSHADCAAAAAEFRRNEEAKRALVAAGRFVRCAAVSTDVRDRSRQVPWPVIMKGPVLVVFRGAAAEKCCFMSKEVYDAIPILDAATPEDYARHGSVVETGRTWEEDYARVLKGEAVPAPVGPAVAAERR